MRSVRQIGPLALAAGSALMAAELREVRLVSLNDLPAGRLFSRLSESRPVRFFSLAIPPPQLVRGWPLIRGPVQIGPTGDLSVAARQLIAAEGLGCPLVTWRSPRRSSLVAEKLRAG